MQDDLDYNHIIHAIRVSFRGSALRKAHAANDLSGAWFIGVYGDDEMQNPLGLVFLTHVSG
jgi:hypothetical protein